MSESDYVGPIYDPIGVVEAFNGVPRFGHSDDPVNVLDDGRIDYIQGTVFVAALLLVTFIAWSIFTLAYKFCGRGILAGKVPNIALATSDRKIMIMRCTALAFTLLLLGSSLIFPTKGRSVVNGIFHNIEDGWDSLSSLTEDAADFAEDILDVNQRTIEIRQTLIDIIDQGVCPNMEGAFDDLETAAADASASLKELEDLTDTALSRVREDFLTSMEDTNTFIDKALVEADKWEDLIPLYVTPIFILCSFFFITTILEWKGVKPKFLGRCLSITHTWVALPLFYLTIFGCFLVSAIIGTAAVVNSDVCLGGVEGTPESTIESFVIELGTLEGESFDAFKHYVTSGCRSPSPLPDMEEICSQVDAAILDTEALNDAIVGGSVLLNLQQCAGGDFSDIAGLAENITALIDNLKENGNTDADIVDYIETVVHDVSPELAEDIEGSGADSTDEIIDLIKEIYGDSYSDSIGRRSLQATSLNCAGDDSNTGTEVFSTKCGRDFDQIFHLGANITQLLTDVKELAQTDLLDCERINDIVVTFIQGGVCGKVPSALSWVFASFVSVSFFALLLFSFRSVTYPTPDGGSGREDDDSLLFDTYDPKPSFAGNESNVGHKIVDEKQDDTEDSADDISFNGKAGKEVSNDSPTPRGEENFQDNN